MTKVNKKEIHDILSVVDENVLSRFDSFRKNIVSFLIAQQKTQGDFPAIHSVKSRIKNTDHLFKKVHSKIENGEDISKDNFFQKITDIGGIRILHIYQEQFEVIHKIIMDQIDNGDWVLLEDPKAYIWDPDSENYFQNFIDDIQIKDTHYTSIHYVVKPNSTSIIACEIQVRTLFEEIWGEIDHAINYPEKTRFPACEEQIRVLAKLVNAGSRLGHSIFHIHNLEKKTG